VWKPLSQPCPHERFIAPLVEKSYQRSERYLLAFKFLTTSTARMEAHIARQICLQAHMYNNHALEAQFQPLATILFNYVDKNSANNRQLQAKSARPDPLAAVGAVLQDARILRLYLGGQVATPVKK
jgi:hypothetical protein